jgi:hypothetical protein
MLLRHTFWLAFSSLGGLMKMTLQALVRSTWDLDRRVERGWFRGVRSRCGGPTPNALGVRDPGRRGKLLEFSGFPHTWPVPLTFPGAREALVRSTWDLDRRVERGWFRGVRSRCGGPTPNALGPSLAGAGPLTEGLGRKFFFFLPKCLAADLGTPHLVLEHPSARAEHTFSRVLGACKGGTQVPLSLCSPQHLR